MKFIADVMLGRLAKRLRLIGLDVLYDTALDDNGIIRLSLEQDRVILTRDTGLAARPIAANHLFITSDRVQEQVEQVRSAFPLDALPLTRCSACNEPLAFGTGARRGSRTGVCVRNQYAFLRCPGCERIYWKGSHVGK
jgi:uncharacterized protein with PIN domain